VRTEEGFLKRLAKLIGIAVGIVVLTSPFWFPVRADRSCERRRSLHCFVNLRSTAFALLTYIQDYDEVFPPASRWMDCVLPYLRQGNSPDALRCPSVSPPGFGYAYNSRLSKVSLLSIERSAQTPLVYDSFKLSRNASDPVTSLPDPPRHEGFHGMCFTDGHARGVKPGTYGTPP
jgi:hypothetical protein